MKLNFFENPVTSDRFEYASEPLMIKVVQESNPSDRSGHYEVHDRVKFIVCGENHTMALTEQGILWSWGLATHGQLGVIKRDANINLLLTKDG